MKNTNKYNYIKEMLSQISLETPTSKRVNILNTIYDNLLEEGYDISDIKNTIDCVVLDKIKKTYKK